MLARLSCHHFVSAMAPGKKSRANPRLSRNNAAEDGSPRSKKAKTSPAQPSSVSAQNNPNRVRTLKQAEKEANPSGPVVYWMSRDQRSCDNWALLYAAEQANNRGTSLAVVFNLVDHFLEARARHFGFMLRGLRIVDSKLKALGIPFFLLQGKAEETVPDFIDHCGASILVVDFSPLRIAREWRDGICKAVKSTVTVYEVDAHNVVPVWVASEKQEYGARTIRGKIHSKLSEYLVDYPHLEVPKTKWTSDSPKAINWDSLIEKFVSKGAEVPEIQWCEPGEDAAMEVLLGKKGGFLTTRIKNYANDRNDPSKPSGLSGLSPYLHYGQISPQQCAFEAQKCRKSHPKDIDAFLEELVVRRELAENFCFYQPNYDNLKGAYDWARKTLSDHASDEREFLYSLQQLEKAETYDELWNASQLELVHLGKVHGFMRMYWAKKILEWTKSGEEALAFAIYLNDKYEIDGRDPNGYVGCMWSVCGIHDQGWRERPVFGKIRYMNYNGCKRKFNVDGYIKYVKEAVAGLSTNNGKEASKITPSSTPSKHEVL